MNFADKCCLAHRPPVQGDQKSGGGPLCGQKIGAGSVLGLLQGLYHINQRSGVIVSTRIFLTVSIEIYIYGEPKLSLPVVN
jgi:hypothetical protein